MLYATLEEAYNVTSFKKSKKKKGVEKVEENPNILPYDKYEPSMVDSNNHTRMTSENQCDPLQAPPYVFPIEEKAKKQYEQALSDMNKVNSKIESNIEDELDTYLDDEEYAEFNNVEIEKPNKTDKTVKTVKPVKSNKKEVESHKTSDSNVKNKTFDRLSELFLLLLLAILICIMCEIIVRLAKA